MDTAQLTSALFGSYQLGSIELSNRVVMAPMTRARSATLSPTDETALYYKQRASAGLIVSEGIPVSDQARGYVYLPGLETPEQVEGWRKVTTSVHEASGRIFAQLWHVGRVSHHSLQPGGAAPVGSSAKPAPNTSAFAIRPDGTPGFVKTSEPRGMTTEEVGKAVEDFRTSAANAIAAGFDGIEVHGANGYLFEQFLNPTINDRTDKYGGSIENRARLLLEVIDRISDAIGPDRTGVRLSPFAQIFDNDAYPEAKETYDYLAVELGRRGIAYVHLHEVGRIQDVPLLSDSFLQSFRATFGGPIILAGGLNRDLAEDFLERGLIDLAGFGRPFVANPDLVERLDRRRHLADVDPATLYGGGAEGYTDYPTFAEAHDGSTSASLSRVIAAPAADVWAVVREFGDLDQWMPGLPGPMKVVGDPQALGAERIFTTPDGSSIVERLMALDDQTLTTSYSIVSAPIPLTTHLGTITVAAEGDSALVTWGATFTTEPAFADILAKTMTSGTFESGLQALAELFERPKE